MTGLTKIRAGLYKHEATGRLVVLTDGWTGPRGGNRRRWELAHEDAHGNVTIDSVELFPTLRKAVEHVAADTGSGR